MPIVARGVSAALVRRLYTKPQGRFAFRAKGAPHEIRRWLLTLRKRPSR
jgi:hypothetical protein